jgi:hypothetical protein
VSLAAFVLRRVLWAIPVLLLVMLATFRLMRGAGGTPFEPPEGVPGLPAPLQREMTEFYNLDEPWYVEFVATLDFDPSLVNRNDSVDEGGRGDAAVRLRPHRVGKGTAPATRAGAPRPQELGHPASLDAAADARAPRHGSPRGSHVRHGSGSSSSPAWPIAVFAIAANLLADGLGDALDPRRWPVVRSRGRAARHSRPPAGGCLARARRSGEGRNRTGDTTVFSRVLYQLSYLAEWGVLA